MSPSLCNMRSLRTVTPCGLPRSCRAMIHLALFLSSVDILLHSTPGAAAFSFPLFAATTGGGGTSPEAAAAPKTSDYVKKVAVAGATGRVGSLVVRELLDRNVNVVALVRDSERAKERFPIPRSDLRILECDLASEEAIFSAVEDCDAAIWCATGFSDAPGLSVFDRMKRLLGVALTPKSTIDAVGIPALAKAFSSRKTGLVYPKVVMLSSAGVTRPSWDEAKKKKLAGCADIPIVRLNPFGILDIKAESEEKLRKSGSDYCIVRPCGLKDSDKWPAGARPVFSQGDVAVGRINRQDVASVLVNVLAEPQAVGKTFEVIGLAGYPPPRSIGMALARLKKDSDGPLSEESVAVAYAAMQQLLPGEKQDAAALAMGQTYEQLDKGTVGRLGERGKEDAEAAAPKPT